jgi:hypothetical protein
MKKLEDQIKESMESLGIPLEAFDMSDWGEKSQFDDVIDGLATFRDILETPDKQFVTVCYRDGEERIADMCILTDVEYNEKGQFISWGHKEGDGQMRCPNGNLDQFMDDKSSDVKWSYRVYKTII